MRVDLGATRIAASGAFHTRAKARDRLCVNGADGARSAAAGVKGTPKAPSLMVGHERAHNAGRSGYATLR